MTHSNQIVGEKTFKFYNVFDEDKWCEAQIKVSIINNHWYYYTIVFNYPNKNSIEANPFKNYKMFFDDGNNKDDIIVKNSVNEKLIEYLLMDYEELSKHCGNSTHQRYKAIIMMQIMLAWE